MGGREHVAGGAVVLLQLHHPCTGEVLVEVEDVAHVGAAPAVDGLVVVPHHADVPPLPAEQPEQPVLGGVGVLELVHEQVAEAGGTSAPAARRPPRAAGPGGAGDPRSPPRRPGPAPSRSGARPRGSARSPRRGPRSGPRRGSGPGSSTGRCGRARRAARSGRRRRCPCRPRMRFTSRFWSSSS